MKILDSQFVHGISHPKKALLKILFFIHTAINYNEKFNYLQFDTLYLYYDT